MNDTILSPQTQSINLTIMTDDDVKKLQQECEKELDKRHKEEVRKFKADMKKKAEKFGLVVKVETKK